MKKIVLFCLLGLIMPFCLNAQSFDLKIHSNLDNEIGVSAGPNSVIGGTIVGVVGVFDAVFSSLAKKKMALSYYGEYGLHYYHQIKPWCQVGVKATVESSRIIHYTDTFCRTISSDNSMILISLMPSVRFTYLNRPWVRLYSGVDLGCSYGYNKTNNYMNKSDSEENPKNHNFTFAFNVTPIGVNVGKKFFGMFELNFGFDSWAKAGFGCRW